jgi:TPR repeat protein
MSICAPHGHGKGVEQSAAEALRWYGLSSVNGNAYARTDLERLSISTQN